ncbi:YheC/YheD family protein [Paenibacillus sp. FSL W8-1187]|uniref:YheC/YheD family protein n=1 Tax=Paenibacillus sp. FSL W8-1187 TaxID=2975339 RepID=UPI00042396E8|nr:MULTISPECIES: YheC/YheD family protein [Paenibacillus]
MNEEIRLEAAPAPEAAAALPAPAEPVPAAAAEPLPAHAPAEEGAADAEEELAYVQKVLSKPFPKGGASGRMLASKWAKTAALLGHPSIAPHIPPTRLYSEAALKSMLDQHGMVVIKPVRGTGGLGVIKISRVDGGYSYSSGSSTKRASSIGSLHLALKPLQKGRSYLIQKGIHLATVGGRPIDYRVKYVKNGARWEIRSMVGRVARSGLFVTNLCRGGSQLTASQGIGRSLPGASIRGKKQEMRRLTRLSAAVLESKFPGIGQLGFDYGLDRSGKIWIFEVNTRPK